MKWHVAYVYYFRINRLTLTWDVLKYVSRYDIVTCDNGLTLTWDVLKYGITFVERFLSAWLTLTWDVLKY